MISMKKTSILWSVTGALGIVALGAGVAVAQPTVPATETVVVQTASQQKAAPAAPVMDSAQSAASATSAVSARLGGLGQICGFSDVTEIAGFRS